MTSHQESGVLDPWKLAIDRASRNSVQIQVDFPHPFDGLEAEKGQATGFVIDPKNGIIVTNRHVVSSGPVRSRCTFLSGEMIVCRPVYIDPVHDFALVEYDPSHLKHTIGVDGLDMCPQEAVVGLPIVMTGNDAGEKLTILHGTISRVDSNAPKYGAPYRDSNIAYYQSNTLSRGGSSGSPIVAQSGHAVAMHSGGRDDAGTAWFLPLDRIVRALDCYQQNIKITRGDIQATFYLQPFDECRRLGLGSDVEALFRDAFPDIKDMLVADTILPEGPSDGKIREGDILTHVNGNLMASFTDLEDVLDNNVGTVISVRVQRGENEVEVQVEIEDLHQLIPDRYLSVSGMFCHNISYHWARLYGIAVEGVFVSHWDLSNGHKGSGWILEKVNHQDINDLDALIKEVREIPDRAMVPIQYHDIRDLHTPRYHIVRWDRHWSPAMIQATRAPETGNGAWNLANICEPLAPAFATTRKATFRDMSTMMEPKMADLISCFVRVSASIPRGCEIEGFPRRHTTAMGLVTDADKGLVLVSRAIVPHELCDVWVTVADSITLAGTVVLLHPSQNYAVVRYDPTQVDAHVKSAPIDLKGLRQGDKVDFLGFLDDGAAVCSATEVTQSDPLFLKVNEENPCYRAINIDVISISSSLGPTCKSGVLVADGKIRAVWLNYLSTSHSWEGEPEIYENCFGFSVACIQPVLSAIIQGERPHIFSLSVELQHVAMNAAFELGVSDTWIEKAKKVNPVSQYLLRVEKRILEVNPAGDLLLEGDIVLSINGKICTAMQDFDVQGGEVEVVVVRGGKEQIVRPATKLLHDTETRHVVQMCGAVLHRPHYAVRQHVSEAYGEVYISLVTRGSPAARAGLRQHQRAEFITRINDRLVTGLTDLLEAFAKIPDQAYFRVHITTHQGLKKVITMQKDEHYFPTIERRLDAGVWQCKDHSIEKRST